MPRRSATAVGGRGQLGGGNGLADVARHGASCSGDCRGVGVAMRRQSVGKTLKNLATPIAQPCRRRRGTHGSARRLPLEPRERTMSRLETGGAMLVSGIGTSTVTPRASRRDAAAPERAAATECRALIPVAAAASGERSATLTRRPQAAFLAHLIATTGPGAADPRAPPGGAGRRVVALRRRLAPARHDRSRTIWRWTPNIPARSRPCAGRTRRSARRFSQSITIACPPPHGAAAYRHIVAARLEALDRSRPERRARPRVCSPSKNMRG